MRKHHQKQLLGLIQTLGEAHAEAERLFSAKKTEIALGLLSHCRKNASRIGSIIEELEGEGTRTVVHLEEYGEILHRIDVDTIHEGNDSGFFEQLDKQLLIIENSVRTDLKPNRIEMVFLPYKVSMWDSMESVWRAANADPDCDAHVIPLPYYDRRPDGTFGQMHCEGGEFPEDVPIIDWQKYNFAERRPDVIVIHSPYDDNNHVKSVHPDFYSKQLKEFTDLLVYIPYFVCLGNISERFVACTGTLHADKVVVQSDRIRDTYIRVFREIEKRNNCPGGFGNLEEKFIALGSPKFDKVIDTKREDCKIPDAWRKLIEKPDGTRKKVVLYNTCIEVLLEGNEKVLHKLRRVFDCFRERDDVVLLWRPHPMSAATYESMRPQLYGEYQDIVAEYRRQGFGIYDDTADPHRAIAVSDAYYGDAWSSLQVMFTYTGKPVLMQNFGVLPENKSEISLSKNADICNTMIDCAFGETSAEFLDAFLRYVTQDDDSGKAVALHDKQIEVVRKTNANVDGTSGAAIFSFCKKAAQAGRGE
ncbi:MAG: hypothetical protein LBQ62_04690 [Candidatus Accumulibacter sp.]|jgi:hypothetical protein|nr:hypothetical protein [Accumulibacter sp.]